VYLQLSPINAKIMKAMNHVHEMEAKVGQFAVLDYRAVVLPFVKSLLKSRLEGEAEKDAMKKSDAAQEAFLAELAKDKKSSTTKESELSKQARDKAKDKKKLRDQKKPRDVKVSKLYLFSCRPLECYLISSPNLPVPSRNMTETQGTAFYVTFFTQF
jgi:hypothetical protein